MVFSVLFVLFWLVFGVGGTAFWIWMLVDCAKNEPRLQNDRVFWLAIIAVTNLVGASVYFFARRPERMRLARGEVLELE